MFDYLRQDPQGFLLFMLYRAPAVLLALTFHEVAHGYVALRCGDPTAKRMGRLSLNPTKHLDLIGTISMFIMGFGWAKPVPVNPNNFRRGSRDDLLVSLAGVTTNMVLFILSTLLAIIVGHFLYEPEAMRQLGGMAFFLDFNSDGFTLQLFPEYVDVIAGVLKAPLLLHVQRFLLHFCMVNLGLSLFNLLPIPPLDGFHVVNDLLLKGRLQLSGQVFRFAQVALIVLMFSTNIAGKVVGAGMDAVQTVVLGGMLAVFGV